MPGKENRKISCGFWIWWSGKAALRTRHWGNLWGNEAVNFEGLSEEYLPGFWGSKEASVCWRSGREDKVRDLWGADTLGSCRPSTCLWAPLWVTWGTWRGRAEAWWPGQLYHRISGRKLVTSNDNTLIRIRWKSSCFPGGQGIDGGLVRSYLGGLLGFHFFPTELEAAELFLRLR